MVKLHSSKTPSDVFCLIRPFCQKHFAVRTAMPVCTTDAILTAFVAFQVHKAAGVSPRGKQARPYAPYMPPADGNIASQPGNLAL